MSESAAPREMGVSDARANLTEVIARVRLLGEQVVLTRRDKPQAVLVSPDFYDTALVDRRLAEAVQRAVTELPGEAALKFTETLAGLIARP